MRYKHKTFIEVIDFDNACTVREHHMYCFLDTEHMDGHSFLL